MLYYMGNHIIIWANIPSSLLSCVLFSIFYLNVLWGVLGYPGVIRPATRLTILEVSTFKMSAPLTVVQLNR